MAVANKIKYESIEPGMVIGRLTIERPKRGPLGGRKWICKCECGNPFVANENNLRLGMVKSCGCAHQKVPDIINQRFGKLTVLARLVDNPMGKPQWFCYCDCGNYTVKTWIGLHKEIPSCGCTVPEVLAKKSTTHGMRNTPLFRVWSHMRGRCNNPTDHAYKHYGGRGIYVCDRWNEVDIGFRNFVEDMGSTYQPGLQLDRINNDGPYSPENCRWATPKENVRNRRNTVMVNSIFGRMSIAELAEKTGISRSVLYSRLKTHGSPDELITVKGVYDSESLRAVFAENDAAWLDGKTEKRLYKALEEAEAQVRASDEK